MGYRDPAKQRAWQRANRQAHLDERRARDRADYHDHLEQERATARASYHKHREQRLARNKAYRKANPEKIREISFNYYHQNRENIRAKKRPQERIAQANAKLEAFDTYGGRVCICCGEREVAFLTLDHIAGDGAEHRREAKTSNLYRWLKRRGYPRGLRVLCYNCNNALAKLGYCPHGNVSIGITQAVISNGNGYQQAALPLEWTPR